MYTMWPCGCGRCSKDDNVNEKTCSKSAGTPCTLDACRGSCAALTGGPPAHPFACEWYAHDAAKGDCYAFRTCENASYHEDYTLHRLAPPPRTSGPATLAPAMPPTPEVAAAAPGGACVAVPAGRAERDVG